MKKILQAVIVCAMTLMACTNDPNQRIVSSSSGNINSLTVVVDNVLWQGNIGEAIRDVLGAPVYGLPQEEPLFTMSHIPPQVFSDFTTKNRIILKIEKGKDKDLKFLKNVYAKPQRVILITGQNDDEIIEVIKTEGQRIVSSFKNEEIAEKQRRIKKSLHKHSNIENTLGLTINFPSVYRVATEDNGFYWIRKDTEIGSMNLMLFQLPIDAIEKNDSTINQIIRIRDSIGEKYIPGPVEGSHMITEMAYTPFLNETIIDNKPTLETKSTWEVKNAYMAGPFINYIIEDKQNDRLIVAEGFTYAPASNKRNSIFELEAIIRSIKIK